MAQIGFTAKTEHVYDRFNKMRRDYVEKHGRTYAPDFLTVLMDGFEAINQINAAREEWVKCYPKTEGRFVLEVTDNGIQLYCVYPDREGDEWIGIEQLKPVSLRAYIAEAEANEQVVIKDCDNRYINNAIVATTNLFLTDQRDEAKVFNNRDQAAAFLRKYGRDAGNWVIEPA